MVIQENNAIELCMDKKLEIRVITDCRLTSTHKSSAKWGSNPNLSEFFRGLFCGVKEWDKLADTLTPTLFKTYQNYARNLTLDR